MRDYIETQIAERREALNRLERDRIALQGELRAYEDMKQKLADDRVASGEQRASVEKSRSAGESDGDQVGSPAAIRLTANWLKTLLALRNEHEEFTGDDVLRAAARVNYETNMTNVRSQLSAYTERGWLNRLTLGRYEIRDVLHERLDEEQMFQAEKNKGSGVGASEPSEVPGSQSDMRPDDLI